RASKSSRTFVDGLRGWLFPITSSMLRAEGGKSRFFRSTSRNAKGRNGSFETSANKSMCMKSHKAPLFVIGLAIGLFSCASLPEPKFKAYDFPEGDVFVDTKPSRRFKVLGPVRVRVNYNSLNPDREAQELCRNAFNKGASDLLKRAKRDQKGDAVIDVRSVVFYLDGKSEK